MKLMIIGHGGHGKDTVCKHLVSMYNLRFVSSSYFVAEKAVKPYLRDKYGIIYSDFDSMYADRINHREKWHNAIADYNKDDPTRLGKELFAEYDIYCGNRNPAEFEALKAEKVFQCAFWIDASERISPEPSTSMKLSIRHADYVINNNGPACDLGTEIFIQMRRAMDDGLIPYQPVSRFLD
jgi:hypothetical protein